ncbi:MAG: ABC transporter permease [Bdellovibrionales bacterium]|nr:ABC transporter permease [Bdellovibrionales bacterium]
MRMTLPSRISSVQEFETTFLPEHELELDGAEIPMSPVRAEDLRALEKSEATSGNRRPSLSYWKDAFLRFQRNKQAVVAAGLIFVLLAFVLAGPLLWDRDPHFQDMNRVSRTPTLGDSAVVVDLTIPWVGKTQPATAESAMAEEIAEVSASDLESVGLLEVLEGASTQGVRLQWDAVRGARSYAIYRSETEVTAGMWGVPLGETASPDQLSFEDTMSLEPKTYVYVILPKNSQGEEGMRPALIKVDVPTGLTLDQALQLDPQAAVGRRVLLTSSPLGTDGLGRDMLARLMYGGRISLFIGVIAAVCYVLLGILIGGIAGYVGGRTDSFLMRFTDFVMGLPFLLFVILLKVIFNVQAGETGLFPLMMALIGLSWTGSARLVRGQVLQLKDSDYVQAARLLGASPAYLILRHMIPNIMGVILVTLTFGIPASIFSEAFLSFIGLGVASPAASWGSMCTEGVQTIFTRPYEFFFPALCISLTVLAFNLLGDGLRDALDPKMRGQE